MKIAMVFDGLQTGGIERVGSDYARILTGLGHEITVINLQPRLTEMESEFPDGCRFVHINFPRQYAPENYAQCIKKDALGKFRYPIGYCARTMINAIYRPFCRRREALRGEYDLAIAFAGHMNDLTFVSSGFVRAKKQLCWLHGALYGYLLLSDGFLNLYNKIKNLIVLVEDAQEEVFMTNKQLSLNIHKLYNPTFIKDRPIDEALVSELQEKYGKFLIMVARFDYPHKDHYTAAKALKLLNEQYGQDLHLVFVGDGPEMERVRKFVHGLGQNVEKNIHFAGNQRDVQNYYKAAFLLVHASVAGEGLPTVMLEAMAYGLPMVVTDSKVGPREILKNNEFGLLCGVQDAEDMAKQVYRLCTEEGLYEHYQRKGRERLEVFMPEAIQSQLENIIGSL